MRRHTKAPLLVDFLYRFRLRDELPRLNLMLLLLLISTWSVDSGVLLWLLLGLLLGLLLSLTVLLVRRDALKTRLLQAVGYLLKEGIGLGLLLLKMHCVVGELLLKTSHLVSQRLNQSSGRWRVTVLFAHESGVLIGSAILRVLVFVRFLVRRDLIHQVVLDSPALHAF